MQDKSIWFTATVELIKMLEDMNMSLDSNHRRITYAYRFKLDSRPRRDLKKNLTWPHMSISLLPSSKYPYHGCGSNIINDIKYMYTV